MTRYPTITIEVKDWNGDVVYTRSCSHFDIAERILDDSCISWVNYLEETEDVRKEELSAEVEEK